MKPLIVLLLTFIISMFIIRVINKTYDITLSGRIAMAVMLVFTAIGHFAFTKGMSMMIPRFLPFKETIVYMTGVFEIVLAMGLLIPSTKQVTGWGLIIFLLLLLPANIYASLNHINYQTGTLNGHGIGYLWFRVPLQLLFIAWTYLCAIRF